MKKHTLLWIILTAVVVFGAAAAAVLLAHSGADEKPTDPTVPVGTTAPIADVEDVTETDQAQITVALSEYRVLLNWTAVEGADQYTITYDDGSGPVDYGTTNRNSFRKKGLKGGTAYTFTVTPYRTADGQSLPVGTPLSVSGHTLPDIPVYTAVRDGDTCRLSWTAVHNADEYRIFSSPDGENWTQEGSAENTDFSFDTDAGNKKYTAVKAVIRTDAGEIVSDYTKTLIPDTKERKKLCSYGDSVAVGIGSHNYSYADIFAEEHDLELIDRSNAGSELSSNNPKKHHIAESILKDVTPDYDYVFIEGGNNDHYFNSPLGALSPEGTTDFDMQTTVGALEAAFTYLREACPDTEVVFIMVHKRAPMTNELGMSFEEYAAAITAVCERYGVPVADCLNDSGFDTADAEICNEYTHHFNGVFPTGDGVHPTEAAYRKYYIPLIEAAMEKSGQNMEKSGQNTY
jgi:lysophospholipase L1-like esterase